MSLKFMNLKWPFNEGLLRQRVSYWPQAYLKRRLDLGLQQFIKGNLFECGLVDDVASVLDCVGQVNDSIHGSTKCPCKEVLECC